MLATDIIAAKRDGRELGEEEIRWLIAGYTAGRIPDYQMAALLMAAFLRGMTPAETAHLTRAMVASGDTVDLGRIPGTKVDKHSTGGVGDKTTLILGPLVAAAGVAFAKMSGRGLGHTGGTLDKLASIPGFRVQMSSGELAAQVNRIGIAIAGQTRELVPADGKLYALRDVTATVESIPLIASSIMSKKIAGGADAVILDVKVGAGAFMKTLADARRLAVAMVDIGRAVGRRTVAFLTDMEQPLGRAVGNALEVREALETLSGEGPADLRELCLALGARQLAEAGAEPGLVEARRRLEKILARGAALSRFEDLVRAQGGDADVIRNPDLLPTASFTAVLASPESGWVHQVDALLVGRAAALLGAGRAVKGDEIDPAVGVVLHRKIGEAVEKGEPLAVVHANEEARVEPALGLLAQAYLIRPQAPAGRPLILAMVEP